MPAQEKELKIEEKLEKKEEVAPVAPSNFLKTSLSIAKELFIFSLIFYLILFILETVFPGFVSNNFNLNWVLGIVLGLGVISAFAPEEPKSAFAKATADEGKPKIIDYLTAIFLGVLGGILIFFKIDLEPTFKLIVAIISAILIIVLSLVLLLVEDEEVKEREEEIETFVKNTFLSRKTFTTPIAFFRLLLFKKINFPLFLILIVFLFTTLALPRKSGTTPRRLSLERLVSFFKSTTPPKQTDQPTSTLTPTPTPTPIPTISPSTEIMIKVLNGGGEKTAVSDFVKTLKDAGFAKVFFGEADNLKYKNATIRFRPEDKDQSDLIKNLLKEEYLTISEAPSGTTSAEVTVILGTKETKEETTGLEIEQP